MRGTKNVCVVYNHPGRWINNDLDLLRRHFNVTEYVFKRDKKTVNLKNLIKNSDVLFLWFASHHGLRAVRYAKKYNKKIVTVSGGYDVSTIKGYGLASSVKTRWIPKYILKNSDVILAFSNSAKREIENIVDNKNVIVSFGIDTDKFYPGGKKEDVALTVAYLDKVSWERKGINRFVELAYAFAQQNRKTKFIVAGKQSDDIVKKIASMHILNMVPNVNFTRYLSAEDLLKEYQKAKVYVQLSKHEGFGATVAEAMLCDCIPIVSNKGSLPEVIGYSGIVVDANVIPFNETRKALDSKHNNNQRNWILDNYAMERREKIVLEVLK